MTLASAGYWKVMFIPPVLGRYFTDEEDRAGAPKVAVISYALWRSRFNGDRSILGRSITLEGEGYQVIGVAPQTFVFRNREIDYWIPLHLSPQQINTRQQHFLTVVARLKPGLSV